MHRHPQFIGRWCDPSRTARNPARQRTVHGLSRPPTRPSPTQASTSRPLDTPEGKATLSATSLLYHVVPAEVPAANVTECMTANAVNGQPFAFTVAGGVMVNDANVTLPDVATSNGIIHVIDKVLTPTDTPNDMPRTAQCTGIHNSLVLGGRSSGTARNPPGRWTIHAFRSDRSGLYRRRH